MSERTVVVSKDATNYHRVDTGDEDRVAVCGGFKESNLKLVSEIEALKDGYDPCGSCRWVDGPDEPPEDLPEETYITARPGNSRHYHTTKTGCDRVDRGNRKEPRPVSESAIRYHGLTPCPDCSLPDYEPPDVEPKLAADGGEPDPSLVKVVASGAGLALGTGTLHRYDETAACDSRPESPRSMTDLTTAAVPGGHDLCDNCEWPDGAEEVLDDD